jgi:MazG family protein
MEKKVTALKKLAEVIDRLRGPQGCPWDRAQKLQDMSHYLLSETCEALDAIEDSAGKPSPEICEEIGDVLMIVFLCARIAEDEGSFDLGDVADRIAEKLVRRHPHVFGDRTVRDVDEVLSNWNEIKAAEKKDRPAKSEKCPSIMDRVPRNLPSLERSYEVGRVAAGVGFDWPSARGALEKIVEETKEVEALLAGKSPAGGSPELEGELGDLLFAVANLCRKLEIRPEKALKNTLAKFCRRFRVVEERFPDLAKATLEDMEAAWQDAKCSEGGRDLAGEDSGGRDLAAEDSGGRDLAAEDSGGRDLAAEDSGGRDLAAEDSGGRDLAAEDSGGRDLAAEDSGGRSAPQERSSP